MSAARRVAREAPKSAPASPRAQRPAEKHPHRPADQAGLDAAVRSLFEPRFMVDSSVVPVHTAAPQVVQQSSGAVMRQKVVEADPWQGLGCPRENCAGKEDGIKADLRSALTYTARALSAVAGRPSSATERLLDWYFSDHSESTVATVRERLGYIRAVLQDTLDNDRYGCGIRQGAVAHTGGGDEPNVDTKAPICLDPPYFESDRSPRGRVEALVHEAGHRVGLSVAPLGIPDTYSEEWAFLHLGTAQALRTTESYAKLVGAIVDGASAIFHPLLGVSGGVTSLGGGFAKVHAGLEVEHPGLRGFSPSAGFSAGLLDGPGGRQFVESLFAGVRFAGARPGDKGSVYLGLSGEVSFISGDRPAAGAGVEAKLGYRIGHFDIGLTAGALRDPTPESGARTVYSGGLSFTYIPVQLP